MLTPFPMGGAAASGGIARARANRRMFQRLGYSVDTVGVYASSAVPEAERDVEDIVLAGKELNRLFNSDMAFGGLHLARAAAADRHAREALDAAIEIWAPEIILMEHPWLWPILREVLAGMSARPKVIYSSHNIESDIRPLLYPYCPVLPGAEQRCEEVRQMEREAAQAADLVLAISGKDRAAMEAWGVTAVRLPPTSALATPQGGAETASPPPYAAMVSSAYWPNVDGFFAMFPEGLGFLRQGEYIAAAGSVGPAIWTDPRFGDFRAVNQSRFRALGVAPDPMLGEFLRAAACVILPIQVGGGANMKTADALWSGRPVVCTAKALVGYPHVRPYIGAGVYVADDPMAFRMLVRAGVRGELAPPAPALAAFGEAEAAAILEGALRRFYEAP